MESISNKLLRISILFVCCIFALVIGISGAFAGWPGQVLLISIFVSMAMLFVNYRFMLYALLILMPFASALFIPKIGPFSPINIILVGVCSAFMLRLLLSRMNGTQLELPVLKQFILLFLLPITLGFINGSFHLNEIPAHMFDYAEGTSINQGYYWTTAYLKNILMLIAICIIGVAIIEFGHPVIFVIFYIFSGTFFVTVSSAIFFLFDGNLAAAINGRDLFKISGWHPNYVAGMIMPVLAVSLYVREAVSSSFWRFTLLLAILILVSGIFLTGSRAGFMGMLTIILFFLWEERKPRVALVIIILSGIAIVFLPSVISDRLMMGVSDSFSGPYTSVNSISSVGDQLTSGRIWIYQQLLADVIRNPVFGNGIMSVQWSSLVKSGMRLGEPHSLYMSVLLDIGIVGGIVVTFFYIFVWRLFRLLSKDGRLDTISRGFFSGSAAGLLAVLVWGLGTGKIQPAGDQWFFWAAFGMAMGSRRWLDLNKNKDSNIAKGTDKRPIEPVFVLRLRNRY